MNVLDNLLYTKDHEWIKIEGNEAYIGVTDYAQSELGDIVYVDVKSVGTQFNKGDVIATIEAVKTVSDVFSPVSGEIIEINPTITTDASVINKNPYGEGWIAKIKINNVEETKSLLTAEDYRKHIGL